MVGKILHQTSSNYKSNIIAQSREELIHRMTLHCPLDELSVQVDPNAAALDEMGTCNDMFGCT